MSRVPSTGMKSELSIDTTNQRPLSGSNTTRGSKLKFWMPVRPTVFTQKLSSDRVSSDAPVILSKISKLPLMVSTM